jgi:hypothetical protein
VFDARPRHSARAPALPIPCPCPGNLRPPTGERGAEGVGGRLSVFSSNLVPSWSGSLALWTFALRTEPSVSTSRCRRRPRTFLPPSYPRCSAPTPLVLADSENRRWPR